MRWKTAGEQLREAAECAQAMSPEERLEAAFAMERFAFELLRDAGTLRAKLGLLERIEEEGNARIREWMRRGRVR